MPSKKGHPSLGGENLGARRETRCHDEAAMAIASRMPYVFRCLVESNPYAATLSPALAFLFSLVAVTRRIGSSRPAPDPTGQK